jgi:FK506-binding protein 1
MGISKTVLKNGDGPAPKVGETTTSGYTAYVKETSVPEGKGKQSVRML